MTMQFPTYLLPYLRGTLIRLSGWGLLTGFYDYFRPDGTSRYFRPDGTSLYKRP